VHQKLLYSDFYTTNLQKIPIFYWIFLLFLGFALSFTNDVLYQLSYAALSGCRVIWPGQINVNTRNGARFGRAVVLP
jgi:hypothetical protein